MSAFTQSCGGRILFIFRRSFHMTTHTSPHTNPRASRPMATLAVAGSLLVLMALGACGKKDDSQTVGQKVDSAIAKTEQAASEAKEKASASMAKVEEAMKVDAKRPRTPVKRRLTRRQTKYQSPPRTSPSQPTFPQHWPKTQT